MTERAFRARSLAAQAMGKIDPLTKAVVPPIHVATTYVRDEDNGYSSGFIYGRPDNQTTRETETVLATLEEAKAGALLFSSGMAGGNRRLSRALTRRPCRRLEGDVLGAAFLASDRGYALGPEDRLR
jgi:cystathionine beta-lyase/cystathionine gamma-synthase